MATDIGTSVLDTSLHFTDLKHRRRDGVLEELAALACAVGVARDEAVVCDALKRRERAYSSAIGKAVAVPHARSVAVTAPRLLVGRSRRGVEWSAPDAQPVQLVILALAPAHLPDAAYHRLVERAMYGTRLARQRQRLLEAPDAAAVAAAFRAEDP
jgi:PTS system fructose-specific IIC component